MTNSMMDLEQRRAYIRQIRDSFETADHRGNKQEPVRVPEAERNRFFYVKARFFVAVILFFSFVLCDFTKSEFYGISTEQIVSAVKENYDYTKVEKYVMMFAQEIQKQ